VSRVDCPCGCGAEVPGIVAERERGLRAETLTAAPQHKLPARDHARAYLLTGVPGAGKSTVARLLALHFDRAAHIDVDLVFHHFTVSGLADPATPGGETGQQAELAAANAGAMARNYLAAGYVCVLEGALARRREILACQRALAPYPLHLIVLAPPPEVSVQRDAQRSGKHVAGYFRHLGPLLRDELGGTGLWLDNSGQSPLDTVHVILADGAAGRL
jgi:predicted kinase